MLITMGYLDPLLAIDRLQKEQFLETHSQVGPSRFLLFALFFDYVKMVVAAAATALPQMNWKINMKTPLTASRLMQLFHDFFPVHKCTILRQPAWSGLNTGYLSRTRQATVLASRYLRCSACKMQSYSCDRLEGCREVVATIIFDVVYEGLTSYSFA